MKKVYDPSEVALLIDLGLTLCVDFKFSCGCNYFLSHVISYSKYIPIYCVWSKGSRKFTLTYQNYCGMSKLYKATIEPQCSCAQCRWHESRSNLVAKLFCGVGTCVHNKTTYLPPYVWTQLICFCRTVVEGAPKPQPLNYGK